MLRKVTVHKAAVSSRSPILMINREINLGGRTVGLKTRFLTRSGFLDARSVRGATEKRRQVAAGAKEHRRCAARNSVLKKKDPPRISLSEVFLDALTVVANICGFTMRQACDDRLNPRLHSCVQLSGLNMADEGTMKAFRQLEAELDAHHKTLPLFKASPEIGSYASPHSVRRSLCHRAIHYPAKSVRYRHHAGSDVR